MPTMGVGVFVLRIRPGTSILEFLVGKRSVQCERGPGVWALPGGMLETNETLAACGRREVREETGLEVEIEAVDEFQDCVMGVSDHRPREDHFTFWLFGTYDGEIDAKIVEPTKCDEWRWVTQPEFYELAIQEGEQINWSPVRVWNVILQRLGFSVT